MKKLFESYANIIEEELLDEKRIEFSELNDNIAFFKTSETEDIYEYILVDMSQILKSSKTSDEDFSVNMEDSILGVIDLINANSVAYQISAIAAVKGYGLLLYELGMQTVYPKGIMSDREGYTRSGAFRLYKYYYNGLNPNVEVVKLNPTDPLYTPCLENSGNSDLKCQYKNGNTKNQSPNNPETMALYNSILFMKPNELNTLLAKGEQYKKTFGSNFITLLNKAATNFFNKKYF